MKGSVESAGLFATGPAAASGPEAGHPGASDAGLNCGAPVTGATSRQCGQRTRLHRTIGSAVHEMVHGLVHFDNKLWRTLPMLAVRPGFPTRDDVDGRRARYVSPFALFLMTIFITYIVFSSISPEAPAGTVAVGGKPVQRAEASAAVAPAGAGIARNPDDPRAADVRRPERRPGEPDARARATAQPEPRPPAGPDNGAGEGGKRGGR